MRARRPGGTPPRPAAARRAAVTIATTVASLVALAARPTAAVAQPAGTAGAVRGETRLDVAAAADPLVLAGGGLVADAGTYTRVAVLAGAGAAFAGDRAGGRAGGARAAGEGAVVLRFLVDPFRQASRGLYVGGGVAGRVQEGERPRWHLVGAVGLEGRRRGGLAPAVELGVGGGARLAVVLRQAPRDRR